MASNADGPTGHLFAFAISSSMTVTAKHHQQQQQDNQDDRRRLVWAAAAPMRMTTTTMNNNIIMIGIVEVDGSQILANFILQENATVTRKPRLRSSLPRRASLAKLHASHVCMGGTIRTASVCV